MCPFFVKGLLMGIRRVANASWVGALTQLHAAMSETSF